MKQFLIIIDGPMGAGKTTVAKLLHEQIKNVAHIGLDRIKWLVSGFRRNKAQNQMTREIVLAMSKEYLKQGVSVIIEQGMKQEQIGIYKKIAKAAKVNFFMYKLEASKDVLFKRVAQREQAPNRPKVTQARVLRNYHLYNLYNKDKNLTAKSINTEELKPAQILKLILKDIKATQ